jgi:hypothetical protein
MKNSRQFMSIRLGFFRLWLVASVLWVAVIGTIVGRPMVTDYEYLYSDACKPSAPEIKARGLFSDADVGLCDRPKDTLLSGASALFGPPLALLAIGTMIGWVVAGFKRS